MCYGDSWVGTIGGLSSTKSKKMYKKTKSEVECDWKGKVPSLTICFDGGFCGMVWLVWEQRLFWLFY